MTIKHKNKNISGEDEWIIKNITDNPNGVLTVTWVNQWTDQTKTDTIDLSKHKLQLVKLNNQNDLDLLKNGTLSDINNVFTSTYVENAFEDLNEVATYRESKIFLVPHDTTDDEEGIYREYMWINNDFEVIGSTDINLEPFFLKSNVYNGLDYSTNDSVKALSGYQGYLLNQNKIDKTAIATSLDVNDDNKVLSAKQGKKLQDDKQDKTDNTLSTSTKTVVGAINELNGHVNDLFNNSDFKQAHITVTRDNGVTSKETWLLVNARYDETENKFYKIDKNEKAFGIQFQASGTYPGEEFIDSTNQAIGIWRCPSHRELLSDPTIRDQVNEIIPNGEIGWTFDNGQTWHTFGVMAGWNNLVMFDSYGGFTVGGNGIEVDGNGIFPYMRLTSSKYTITNNGVNEDVYLYGIILNAYQSIRGTDNRDRAWFFGIKAPQKRDSNNNLVTNTSNLSQGTFVVLYNDTADTSWSSSAWTELNLNNLITVANTVANGNTNPVSSDAVYDAIDSLVGDIHTLIYGTGGS